MRVQQIDLSYTDKAGDTLGGATLHVQSRTLSGQEVYTQVSLEAREVRALEQLMRQALRRLTQEALKLI
ncbi:MAG: hypothetical protein OXC18_17990 [Desulfurellaceae bacterium]|nr:hypothetical protein [Desulfurellaceae bacterium]